MDYHSPVKVYINFWISFQLTSSLKAWNVSQYLKTSSFYSSFLSSLSTPLHTPPFHLPLSLIIISPNSSIPTSHPSVYLYIYLTLNASRAWVSPAYIHAHIMFIPHDLYRSTRRRRSSSLGSFFTISILGWLWGIWLFGIWYGMLALPGVMRQHRGSQGFTLTAHSATASPWEEIL